jgi:Ferritin-like
MDGKVKLLPRNASAWQVELIAGNSAISRLESGVGNCFPGLEFDIRNLERRFFPHLAVDFVGTVMLVAEVDFAGAEASSLPPADLETYEALAEDTASANPDEFWIVDRISGSFGPFGALDVTSDDFAADPPREDVPADIWTAVRLLPEGEEVTISFLRLPQTGNEERRSLTGRRVAYLDTAGALNPIFAPGEMTQSLCSPWTHDFRDCGCFYWASNHPDIALPPKAPDQPAGPAHNRPVAWQRTDRGTLQTPSMPADDLASPAEMRHFEINHRWQELGIALEGREQGASYTPQSFVAVPFATVGELVNQVRYAAGVELGVMLEYLSAAYSLSRTATQGTLADDVNAAFSEILRIAIGEMKHLRAVNDMIRAFFEHGMIPEYRPALQVANELPAGGGATRPLAYRSLTTATLDDFIDIERPSLSVDGLYGRILATVQVMQPGPLEATVAAIMADGTDHFDTFNFIKEWLGRHPESDYLRPLREPTPADAAHVALQQAYAALLDTLFRAYEAGLPGGAMEIAEARLAMLARPDGIRGRCEALADGGIRVRFDAPADPRFAPIGAPPLVA